MLGPAENDRPHHTCYSRLIEATFLSCVHHSHQLFGDLCHACVKHAYALSEYNARSVACAVIGWLATGTGLSSHITYYVEIMHHVRMFMILVSTKSHA